MRWVKVEKEGESCDFFDDGDRVNASQTAAGVDQASAAVEIDNIVFNLGNNNKDIANV